MSFNDIMNNMDIIIDKKLGEIWRLSDTSGGFVCSFHAVFDYEYIEIQGIESRAPVLSCYESNLPDDLHNLILSADSQTNDFKIMTPQPDGTGRVNLVLEKI